MLKGRRQLATSALPVSGEQTLQGAAGSGQRSGGGRIWTVCPKRRGGTTPAYGERGTGREGVGGVLHHGGKCVYLLQSNKPNCQLFSNFQSFPLWPDAWLNQLSL